MGSTFKCQECESGTMACVDTRMRKTYRKRRYHCTNCENKISSVEIFEKTTNAQQRKKFVEKILTVAKMSDLEFSSVRTTLNLISKSGGKF